MGKITHLDNHKTDLASVEHVYIESERGLIQCKNCFPNASQLTFSDGFATTHYRMAPLLARIVPLQMLTILNLDLSLSCL